MRRSRPLGLQAVQTQGFQGKLTIKLQPRRRTWLTTIQVVLVPIVEGSKSNRNGVSGYRVVWLEMAYRGSAGLSSLVKTQQTEMADVDVQVKSVRKQRLGRRQGGCGFSIDTVSGG
jgi:hypothetical protein